ncbi:MAG: monovalent cation/H(+) antiporter subunit G [Alphaproteobacteria bacterium]|jgi:multicomponent Na+:H+ antiporter subunit G|nr:monovalent cation/H(+) antiporter subunit G [Alphaproteobacteria bacterium]
MTPDNIATARLAAALLFGAAGLLTLLTSALGLLRFPDFYTRAHATLAAETVGAGFVLIALAAVAWDVAFTLRLGLLGIVIAALAPARVHALAVGAHGGGLAPVIGPYAAPQPGRAGGSP